MMAENREAFGDMQFEDLKAQMGMYEVIKLVFLTTVFCKAKIYNIFLWFRPD
jgi:hypothetical protein